jgi:osmoprotectant transport system permease protein
VVANGPNSLIWWHWVGMHRGEIASDLGQHVTLTLEAVLIGIVLSAPAAVAVRSRPRLASALLGFTGLLYTIPSLALFSLLGPLTGYTTRTTTEVALVSYTLLILVRNFLVGLDGLDPDVIDAADGMGFSPLRKLAQVEIPLALPAIVAGIRIATVTTIGLVTIAALFGQGGLGILILTGLEENFHTPVLMGALLSIALAVVADGLLLLAGRLMTPWARARAAAR